MKSGNWIVLVNKLKQAVAIKDSHATAQLVHRLLEMNAPVKEHWKGISELMRMSGELTLAHKAMDAFVSHSGQSPQALYAKAVLLTQTGKMQQAYELILSLPKNVPDRAGREYVLGNTALAVGNTSAAIENLTRAVRMRPGWGPAWLTLASAVNLNNSPLSKRLIADRTAAEKQGDGDLARYFYATGKMHSDFGKYSAAFNAYAKGARILKKLIPYHRTGDEKNAISARNGFDTGFLDTMRQQKRQDSSQPIFVTGLPRSGTTLIEQILNSHSLVTGGAELNIVQHLAVKTGGNSAQDLQDYLSDGKSIDNLTNHYLHLLNERFPESGRVVDKTVDASRFMGLIACALPDAPIIWMSRDPWDNAWSCFRTFFIHGVGWSYDLEDIAHHVMLENALMRYWQKQLGDRLLVVPYGELVEDPKHWIKKILAHCNLPLEEAVFTPHLTDRVVLTASALQVRKPINRQGLNSSAPYKKYLQPFDSFYQLLLS